MLHLDAPVNNDIHPRPQRGVDGILVHHTQLEPHRLGSHSDGLLHDLLEQYGHAMAEITDYARPAGPVPRPLVETVVSRRIRDRAFQRRVISAYHLKCAICGEPLKKGALHELEAAHIRAVNADGPDELRNGISLCKRHHWAFDRGFYTLDLSHRVEWLAEGPDPHGEVIDGAQVVVPAGEHAPHAEYLKWHKAQWERIGA